jgi:GNAT superfamily N-acetyltransferase
VNRRFAVLLAGPEDAALLARLRYELRSELDPPTEDKAAFLRRCTPWMADQIKRQTWYCWLAVMDEVAVGTLWLQLVEKLPNPVGHRDFHGYVSSVYVVPEFRNSGIGSALLQACIAEAEARRVDALFLWPTERSRALYQRHGFAVRNDLLERRPEVSLTPASKKRAGT